jgi:hypothetical protein
MFYRHKVYIYVCLTYIMKCTVNFKRLGRGENPNSLTMFSLFLISYVAFLGELGQAAYKLMRGGRK